MMLVPPESHGCTNAEVFYLYFKPYDVQYIPLDLIRPLVVSNLLESFLTAIFLLIGSNFLSSWLQIDTFLSYYITVSIPQECLLDFVIYSKFESQISAPRISRRFDSQKLLISSSKIYLF
ncbi:MAG: hypothetical protein MHMPM18_004912 [Marteilia pararefringens]